MLNNTQYKIWIETHKLTFSIRATITKYNNIQKELEEHEIKRRTMIYKKPALKKYLNEVIKFVNENTNGASKEYVKKNKAKWLEILESYPS